MTEQQLIDTMDALEGRMEDAYSPAAYLRAIYAVIERYRVARLDVARIAELKAEIERLRVIIAAREPWPVKGSAS